MYFSKNMYGWQERLSAANSSFRRQIFLITDGEPTAHRERGTVFHISPLDLGQCVLMDYIDKKIKSL